MVWHSILVILTYPDQNCGIKMMFLMKFLGAWVFDIAFTKMGSRGFINILQVWHQRWFKKNTWLTAAMIFLSPPLVWLRQNLRHRKNGVVKSVPVQDFNLLDCLWPTLRLVSQFRTTSCPTEEIFPLFPFYIDFLCQVPISAFPHFLYLIGNDWVFQYFHLGSNW